MITASSFSGAVWKLSQTTWNFLVIQHVLYAKARISSLICKAAHIAAQYADKYGTINYTCWQNFLTTHPILMKITSDIPASKAAITAPATFRNMITSNTSRKALRRTSTSSPYAGQSLSRTSSLTNRTNRSMRSANRCGTRKASRTSVSRPYGCRFSIL